jgi:CDP-4-dehydro-6-deoxyglucose reductase
VVVIHYEGKDTIVEESHSVLEVLEGAGFRIPYSCRKGICQSCMLQTDDPVPAQSQQGLRASQIAQGYFLACCCYPQQDISVRPKNISDQVQGMVVDKRVLIKGDDKKRLASVMALFIEVECTWFAGQFVDVWLDAVTVRPYSIASRCDDKKIIELHIKRHDQGLVSTWLCDTVAVGDQINLSVPRGDCFYTDSYHQNPLLMVATGTGLAPLYGILQEALYRGHTQNIYLFHAAGDSEGLYYQAELQQLILRFSNLHVSTVVRRKPLLVNGESTPIDHFEGSSVELASNTSDVIQGSVEGDVVDIVKQRHPQMRGYKIFLCGAPTMVKTLRRACFFQGASSSDILVDAFEVAAIPACNASDTSI